MSIEQLLKSDPKLTAEQAAQLLGIKRQTLDVWRMTGRYQIPYQKIGRAVRYRLSDLQKFERANTVGNVAAEM